MILGRCQTLHLTIHRYTCTRHFYDVGRFLYETLKSDRIPQTIRGQYTILIMNRSKKKTIVLKTNHEPLHTFEKRYLSQFLIVKDRPTRNQALSRETGKANAPKCLVHEERILNMT